MATNVGVSVGGMAVGVASRVVVGGRAEGPPVAGVAVGGNKVAVGGNGVGAGGSVGDVSTPAGTAADSKVGAGLETGGGIAAGRGVLVAASAGACGTSARGVAVASGSVTGVGVSVTKAITAVSAGWIGWVLAT